MHRSLRCPLPRLQFPIKVFSDDPREQFPTAHARAVTARLLDRGRHFQLVEAPTRAPETCVLNPPVTSTSLPPGVAFELRPPHISSKDLATISQAVHLEWLKGRGASWASGCPELRFCRKHSSFQFASRTWPRRTATPRRSSPNRGSPPHWTRSKAPHLTNVSADISPRAATTVSTSPLRASTSITARRGRSPARSSFAEVARAPRRPRTGLKRRGKRCARCGAGARDSMIACRTLRGASRVHWRSRPLTRSFSTRPDRTRS